MKFKKYQLAMLAISGVLFLIGGYVDGKFPSVLPDDERAKPPISVSEPHLLVLYESNDPATNKVIESMQGAGVVRKWMDEHKVKYRIYDKDIPIDHSTPDWIVEAYQQFNDQVPWVLYADQDSGYVGTLPETPDEMISLLEKNQ